MSQYTTFAILINIWRLKFDFILVTAFDIRRWRDGLVSLIGTGSVSATNPTMKKDSEDKWMKNCHTV